MKTNLVLKLTLVLVLLLTVVLYKMNDFYRQEKLFQAETQVKKQITAIKTSVSSQLAAIRNVVSSYEVDIKESQINWVQLDPFFGLAQVHKQSNGTYTVSKLVGRSGTMAEKWNAGYLEKALSVHKSTSSDSIQARLFKDRAGNKYVSLIFNTSANQQTAVVGPADYFQKFFDQDRDGRMISLLVTKDHVLAAHSESDYIASLSDEDQLSSKKYMIEKEEIAGTNLMAVSYTLKKAVAAAWVVPWSVVGLVAGFGFVLIGLLFYGLDPIEKKVERYRKQEREQIFKDVLESETSEVVKENRVSQSLSSAPESSAEKAMASIDLIQKSREESIERAQQAFADPNEALKEATVAGPLRQALANLDVLFKQEHIHVVKDISTSLEYTLYYGTFIKTFENIIRNAIEAVADQKEKKISIRAYDVEQEMTVIEVQDNGIGLGDEPEHAVKVWQPFYTTKSKSDHMGLGLTESLSSVRRLGGDLSIESLPTGGVLVKMIMKKEKAMTAQDIAATEKTHINYSEPKMDFNDDIISIGEEEATVVTEANFNNTKEEDDLDIDLDAVLSLDEVESTYLFTPQKINIEKDIVAQIRQTKSPDFKFQPKHYAVDEFTTRIRRPEKS